MRTSIAVRAWLVVIGVCIAGGAQADGSAERAKELFEEGRTLLKSEQFAEACEKFDESYALDAALGTKVNLAECLQRLGKTARAWRLFTAVAEEEDRPGGNVKRAAFARERAEALVLELATVVIELADPETPELTVTINGQTLTPAKHIEHHVDPGAVKIVVEVPGAPRFVRTNEAAAGATVTVVVPAFGKAAETVTIIQRRSPGRVHAAIALGIGGGVSILGGLIVGGIGRTERRDQITSKECIPSGADLLCSNYGAAHIAHAKILMNTETGLAIAGGALVVAAIITYVTSSYDPPTAAISVIPLVAPGEVGMAIATRF